MPFRLEPMHGLRQHGQAYDVVYAYNVCEMPDGHGAHIQNLDYPRSLWSIHRFRNGALEGTPTGNYISAEDALTVLQEEYT
jgi:hypothetical protein